MLKPNYPIILLSIDTIYKYILNLVNLAPQPGIMLRNAVFQLLALFYPKSFLYKIMNFNKYKNFLAISYLIILSSYVKLVAV